MTEEIVIAKRGRISKAAAILLMASSSLICALALLNLPSLKAQDKAFHDAPASASQTKNPYAGKKAAATAGAQLFADNCAKCHGEKGQGMGNVPSLGRGPAQAAPDGEVFWYVTKGDIRNSMPSWEKLPVEQRWQLVTYVKMLKTTAAAAPKAPSPTAGAMASAPSPTGPFTDFRFEIPGTMHKITVSDLPEPFATKSAENGPRLVPRPADAWPKAPDGFQVAQFATGLKNPRLIITAPNGDFFLDESEAGDIKVFRGISADGKPEHVETFATGLKMPYGIAFYPPGPNPQWVYVGQTNAVLRFPYQNGDMKARGAQEHIADLPAGGGHWTRDLTFSPDGKRLFVAVGSASNVDDPDTTPAEKNRADILVMNPDGSDLHVFAYGIRNAGGGIAIDPDTGELWCSVNERDALGDNLVPDYITHVQEGGFYGWPWWYMGGHQDPRHAGKRPELKDKVITPDVVLQPHNASLEITFYEAKQFPSEYRGDILASEHGSWNKAIRAGYELIRVPLHQTGHATGEYEDFVTGFVLPDGNVWGRPVGVTVAPDGSLLMTDDGTNSIWRITYTGK
jgi:glucose/arabinose dehydrogenase/mono/diheme cytochrome c family protein